MSAKSFIKLIIKISMRAVMQNYFSFEIIDEVIVEGHVQGSENVATIISTGLKLVKETASHL